MLLSFLLIKIEKVVSANISLKSNVMQTRCASFECYYNTTLLNNYTRYFYTLYSTHILVILVW
jgi:hypothetical protein